MASPSRSLSAAQLQSPGGGNNSLGGMRRSPSVPKPVSKPWYANRQWWKQFSVWMSILLSIASLILGAFGEFQVLDSRTQKGLNITSLVVNAISVTISALTSLDWKSAAQIEAELLHHLDSLLVQQPVLAETPGASTPSAPPSPTRIVHVLQLHHPEEEEEGEGEKEIVPLISGSRSKSTGAGTNGNGKAKKKRRRGAFGRRGGDGNDVEKGASGEAVEQ